MTATTAFCPQVEYVSTTIDNTVFLRSDAAATIFCVVRYNTATTRGRLLFEAGVYFVVKSADSNDS